jgi:hypothetical protein
MYSVQDMNARNGKKTPYDAQNCTSRALALRSTLNGLHRLSLAISGQ